MKLSDIRGVTQKIEHGAWVDDLPNLPGVTVKVRGFGNADYRRKLFEKRKNMTPAQMEDEEVRQRLETELLHEAVLQDWSGIDDTPYSSETALKLLTDPELAVFRSAVDYAAGVVAQRGKASLEDAAKN